MVREETQLGCEVTVPSTNCVMRCANLTELNVRVAGKQLAALADLHRGRQLVLDLSEVRFLSAAGVTMLLVVNCRVRKGSGRLSLVNVRAELLEVFRMVRLDRVPEIRTARRGVRSEMPQPPVVKQDTSMQDPLIEQS